MDSEPAAIGLVGAGRMGSIHLEALRRADGVRLAGVVEPVELTRARLARNGTATYASVDELLASSAPDGVLIAAPSDQHSQLIARFAAAGVAILCEKPVGVSVEQARAAAAATANGRVPLQVGYWRRFVPELQALKQRIAAGELGQIIQLGCFQWDHELPSEAFRSHSGGIAVDMGVHEFDQARWLLGQEFEGICATPAGSSRERPGDDPDHATILASMSAGSAVVVSLGRRFPHEDSCWVEVWGTDGHERLEFMWDTSGQRVFADAMVRQAEAFARTLSGCPGEGAGADDAVVALTVAGRAANALAASAAR
ncbi:MAG TPA: Gfo/Idh/MocA family oxidoreductase [Solirubrobacteraceae bacterium]|nr:Gfo/Idh/MocA family oxidoreductase [Solirubrobacteraceae bacterium]